MSTDCETVGTVTDGLHGGYYLAPHLYEVAAVINYPQIQVGRLALPRLSKGIQLEQVIGLV